MTQTRAEPEIFADLSMLCTSAGFVHVIGFFSLRDNFIRFGEQLDAESMESQHAPERLLRTEIATLIGLMVQAPIDPTLPPPARFQEYIDRAQALLGELHSSMTAPWRDSFKIADGTVSLEEQQWAGQSLREPIFYSGESAYGFQYREFAAQKYASDDAWLFANKGFEIKDAVTVAKVVADVLSARHIANLQKMKYTPTHQLTVLPCFVFSADDVVSHCSVDRARIQAVLEAFALPKGDRNSHFTALSEFNATNAAPILHWGDDEYLLLQHYSMLEAIYESPNFWMAGDREYAPTAAVHRGAFVERFAGEHMEMVFGQARVFHNIEIYGPGRNHIGEIDVLVVYGRRAILVQAKSKRMTIEARKGNDLQIKGDFKKAVQDAADQAFRCATALLDPICKLKNAGGDEVTLPRDFDVIQPFCLVSDHYPALAFQARQFLTQQVTGHIVVPLVTDVFALDVMVEMLASPLHFFHYLTLRARFGDRLIASHELTLLGFHLSRNLWLDDKCDMMMLGDDLSVPLDIAMHVRREGIPGARTPDGIMTRVKSTTFGQLLDQIEVSDNPDIGELGLLLLQLGEEAARSFSAGIDKAACAARKDRHLHDLSVLLGDDRSGVTVHCRYPGEFDAGQKLLVHCELRKYLTKSHSWYGLLIDPDTSRIYSCVGLRYCWQFDPQMEDLAGKWPTRPQVPWSAMKWPFD